MIIDINKDRELIVESTINKEVYSKKIVDELPNDVNDYVYHYINGGLVKGNLIDKNYKSQETINEEQQIINENQDEINLDLAYRVAMLELNNAIE